MQLKAFGALSWKKSSSNLPKSRILKILFTALIIVFIIFVVGHNEKLQKSIGFKNLGQNPTPPLHESTHSISESSSSGFQIKVKRVVDGDTIELENGQKVRYIGINTPETIDPRKPVECFGHEASNANKQLVEGQVVSLIKDISETDKYSRLLRYVYIGDKFVNDYLIRQGFAYATIYPPDIKFQDQFLAAQKEAQAQNRGLWSTCSQVSSPLSSIINQSVTSQTPPDNCTIKGNISSSGEKIYHMPGQRYYDQTVIDESKGERWFCTEEEAIAASWRKSKI